MGSSAFLGMGGYIDAEKSRGLEIVILRQSSGMRPDKHKWSRGAGGDVGFLQRAAEIEAALRVVRSTWCTIKVPRDYLVTGDWMGW